MLKSRIVAIALISIILSSSSFSVADGNTVWLGNNDIKAAQENFRNESTFYKINLIDNVASSLTNNNNFKSSPYKIKLFDDVSILLNVPNNRVDQTDEKFSSEKITVRLSDEIKTNTTDFGGDDSKIMLIKQNHDKKALWERIFPLDRIRNISKSFFKIIQNDHILSYLQISEISSNKDDYSIEQTTIYGLELKNLSEFEKFVGKTGYVYDQIGIRALNLLDVDKFISKSGYVSDQIAIRAQHLADPEKFVGKSRFVGQQITIQVYQVVDPKNPTLLVLLIPLVGIVLIRNENDKIKFYHIQKIISFIFAVILISSAVITPFSYSVMYWGRAFAQEDPLGKDAGPPEEPIVEQLVETVKDVIDEITEPPPAEELSEEHAADLPLELPVEEPIAELPVETLPEEPIQLPPGIPADTTTQEQNNIIIPTRNDLTTTFDENIVLTDDHSNELEQIQNNQTISLSESFNLIDIISLNNETQQTQNNQTILFNETIVLTDTITSPNIPQNKSESLPEYISFIDDIILSLQNQTNIVLPNATESWQFENDTSDVTFNDDAEIDYTEGINGTSLILDGQLDYAQTNRTNATTYITDMSIAAWVKPNYTNGSPEFTVVSKGKSFVLSINNIIDPQHVAKFAVFDGIKWTTVESYSTIPDSSWSHITARFNKTSIALYVNGTLEGTVTHGGVPYITEKGQIELKTLQEITSYYDIVIGAALKPNMDDRPYNMFSGMIDGVQLFDYRLGPDDVMNLYLSTIPIKAPIIPPEIRRPEPVLRYRVIKGNETLPISIPVDDLNEDLNQLTVSTWIKPNFTGGSPEFTVLSRENSFILSLNKIVLPERVAKFSVYNGISWHTATGSTPIDGWTHVAAVINGSSILIYVNGTLDGKLETGPPWIAGSTANVIIGAYENTNRGDVKWSNYYFGEIGEATVWEYSMVDREIKEEVLRHINQYTNSSTGITTFTLNDGIKSVDYIGISNNTGGKLEEFSEETSDTLKIEDDLILNLNGIPIIQLQASLTFSDNLTLALNQNKVNSTNLPQTLTLTDSLYLKLHNTTYTYLQEGLLITEDILLLLNNQTVTFSNSTSRLTHGIIEIGKPVEWTQTVMLNETDLQKILVELPADAQNITIAKIEQGTSTDIPDEEIIIIEAELEPVQNQYDVPRQKDIVLDKIANEHNAEHVVPLDYATLGNLDEVKQKDKPTKALLINETRFDTNVTENIISQNNTQQNQTEYTVKFQTPAPYALEQDYSTSVKYQKNVTVAHNSTLHYTDVKSYTDIPEYLVLHNTQFKLYWMINDTKIDVTHDQRFNVTFADADANGATDRMEWIVPQLSEQEFGVEADITIINVQSYPTVGGNWTVYFNTTGTADLTITGINGTTFGNGTGSDDLKFLELNNGTNTLSPIVNLTANTITYHNYTSNYTGFEISQVLTEGKHHLMFTFGNDVGYANNLAAYGTDQIRQIIKCSGSHSGAAKTLDVSLTGASCNGQTLADINKAIVYMSFTHAGDAEHASTLRSWELTSTSNLRIEVGDTTPAINADWKAVIVEFGATNPINVQRRTMTLAANPGTTVTDTLPTAVTLAESHIIHSGHNMDDTAEVTIGSEELERVRLASTTTWEWQVQAQPNTGPQDVRAQIVDWNDSDVSVQRGTGSFSGTSTTITPPIAIDRTRTLLFVSYHVDQGNSEQPNYASVRATIDSSNNIVLTRNDSTGAATYAWEVVEFPVGYLTVQHGTITMVNGDATEPATVTAVNRIQDAFAIGTVSTPFGYGGGSGTSTDDDSFGEAQWTIELTATNTVTATRNNAVGTGIVGYQVVDFSKRFENIPTATSGLNTNALHSMVFGDFNNDGYIDMAKSNTVDTSARTISYNDKDGTFTTDTNDLTVGYRGLGWGDYDNSGDLDLVGRDPNVLRNDGGGTWTEINPSANNGESAMWVDIDADGDLDIWEPGATFMWYEQNPIGTFTGRTGLPNGSGSNNVGSITNGEGGSAADINNDGYVDLIWAAQDSATPAYTTFYGGPGTTTNRVYTQQQVISIVDTKSNSVSSSPTTLNIANVVISGSNRYLLVGVGFNNDQDTCAADNIRVSSVTLDPGGASQTSLTLVPSSIRTTTTDGACDDGETNLWGVVNPPVGTFTVRVILNQALSAAGHVLAGGTWSLTGVHQTTPLGTAATNDVDGEPLPITINSAPSDIAFATAFLEDPQTLNSPPDSGTEDWNLGAAEDSAGAHITGAAPTVVIQWSLSGSGDKTVGSGVSVKPALVPPTVNNHENMDWAWGDFDNDGDMDVFISGDNNEGLYRNDGTGIFTDVTATKGISVANVDGADWGDYDNDGDLDIIIADGANTILYTNDGAGTYDFDELPLNDGLNIANTDNEVGWIDYDNDGDLDIMGGKGELYRNNLYDHTDLPGNPNEFLRVLPVGNATAGKGSPTTPIGAQIQIKNSVDMSLVSSSEVFAGYNNFQPPNYRHFGGIDPNGPYNVEVLFPSQTNVTVLWVIPSELDTHELNVEYGAYTLPQAINITETSGNLMFHFNPMRDSASVDDIISFTLTSRVNDDLASIEDILAKAPADFVLQDSASVDDSITWTLTRGINDDLASVEDILVKGPANFILQDLARVVDVLRATTTMSIADSVATEDDIFRIGMRVHDDVGSVEDILVKGPANFILQDLARVVDVLRARTTMSIADSVATEDDIFRIGMRVHDDVGSVEDIIIKAPVTMALSDTATVEDVLRATTTMSIADSAIVEDVLRKGFVVTLHDVSATVEDIIIKAPVTMALSDTATVEDVLRARTTMSIADSAIVEDVLRKGFVVTLHDVSATVEDIIIKAPVTMALSDTATVEDVLRATTTMSIADSAIVEDVLRKGFVVTLHDVSATVEDIIIKAPVTMALSDTATVEDVLRATTTMSIADSAIVEDVLRKGFVVTLHDVSATVEDIIIKAPVTMALSDTATVEDVLRATTIKSLFDSLTVDDKITPIPSVTLTDSATVEDTITTYVTVRITDTVLVEDVLSVRITKILSDSASVDDDLQAIPGKLIFDSATVEDTITAYVTVRITDTVLVEDVLSVRITKILLDSASVDDDLIAIQGKLIFDSATVEDTITAYVTVRITDTVLVEDVLSVRITKILLDSASVDDDLIAIQGKLIFDSATVEDTITAYVTVRITDTVLVEDVLSVRITKILLDSASVDDDLRRVLFRNMDDSVSVNDTLSFYVTIRISDTVVVNGDSIDTIGVIRAHADPDSATVNDSITKIVFYRPQDSASVNDTISFKVTKIIADSVTIFLRMIRVATPIPREATVIDDSITIYVTKGIEDNAKVGDVLRADRGKLLMDSATVEDEIVSRIIYHVNPDWATVDDTIRFTVTYRLKDSVLVDEGYAITFIRRISDSVAIDDSITVIPITVIEDSALIEDSISIHVTWNTNDSVVVEDVLRARTTKQIKDAATVDDHITANQGKLIFDSALVGDIISIRITVGLRDSAWVQDIQPTRLGTYGLEDSATVDDTIQVIPGKLLFDSGTVSDSITKTMIHRLQDSASIQDDITKITFIIQGDQVFVDDNIRVTFGKLLFDSGTVSDSITKTMIHRLQDSASIQDDITKITFIVQGDQVFVDDNIRVTSGKLLFDSGTVSDSITKTVIHRLQDSASIQDDITKLTFLLQSDNVSVDDNIRVIPGKLLFDSGTVSDSITKTVIYRLQDSASVQDDIIKHVFSIMRDQVSVDDTLRVTPNKLIFDSGTVSDSITKTVTYRLQDSASVKEDITKVTFSLQSDNVFVDDIIRVTLGKPLFDSGTVSDSITKTVFYRIQDAISVQDILSKRVSIVIGDEIGLVEDIIRIAPVAYRPNDISLIDDSIQKTVTYRISDAVSADEKLGYRITKIIEDSATVADLITWKLSRSVEDSALIEDTLSFRASLNTKDSATTKDNITWTLIRAFKDSVSTEDTIGFMITRIIADSIFVDDIAIPTVYYRRLMLDEITTNEITEIVGAINIENRQLNGILLVEHSEYRIIPNPITGIGFLQVTDGGMYDNDGIADNGQINVIGVPFGTYRINQTMMDTDYSSVINFTYVTTYVFDRNATALFRVFDRDLTPPNAIPATDSDILDIANYRFDEFVQDHQITRVLNGIQEPLNYTTEMPAPAFVGVDDQNAVLNAADTRYTLLYKNLNLTPNDTPEDIRAAFGQTAYDAGNFTGTTFVGVLSATNQTAFGQYLATQPFDRFNCGQQYVYSLDDTLSQSYGGLARFDLMLDANGACPESEDYITFEITSKIPAGSGVPGLSGEDVLLYVNPQFPRGSITGMGVDFSNRTNIDSFNYTLISELPETGSINDLTVYLRAGGNWTTNGVTELSKQIIGAEPNAGKVEILVSVDHLAKMIVGGKQIPPPPPPPPIPFGQGLIGVGPAGVTGGALDMPTAKVHRVEYDVCNENIVRILATHDSSSPPRIQLLTTKLGVIDATLSINQPFANQNQITLVDRYLFEAPLSKGETVFTIFAVDRLSNVQRTLVQVDGCHGVLVFADDQIVLPHIFDVKYQTNSTYIRPIEYSYITQGQDMTVSAIVESPIVPLRKAELYVSILGTAEQTILPMSIVPLILPDLENVSVISSMIPAYILKGPAVEFWIRIVTEEGVVQESVHSIVGVKPEGYSGESSVEMDTITIKAQGTALKPTAYLTNEGDIPVYSEVSLVSDGKKVYSKPVLLTPGQNIINLEWKIPKTDQTTSYKIQTQLDVYDKSYITTEATLDTFVRTKIVTMSDQSEIVPATDELGNTIARPAMMYSSNEGSGEFRVTAPDGTCVIGAGCLVEESTLKHHGGIDSVLIDGHIYRVRYSGENSPLERFSITSLDSVLGEWNVTIVDSSVFTAAAADDVPIKVQYRAERSPMVTVGME